MIFRFFNDEWLKFLIEISLDGSGRWSKPCIVVFSLFLLLFVLSKVGRGCDGQDFNGDKHNINNNTIVMTLKKVANNTTPCSIRKESSLCQHLE